MPPSGQGSGSGPRWNKPTWTEEDGKYEPDEWLVPAQDSKGHSVRELVRVPPGLAFDLDVLVKSGRFPYRTASDLIRHAILRHVRRLQIDEPDLGLHYLNTLQMIQDLCTESTYRNEQEKTFHEIRDQVEALVNSGRTGEAMRMGAKAKAYLDQTQDSPWKRRSLERFRVDFTKILKAGSVTLVGMAELPAPIEGDGTGAGGMEVMDAEIVSDPDEEAGEL